jgi:hypothetical protein
MNKRLEEFVSETNQRFYGRLRSPKGLLDRRAAVDHALDTTVIGGYSVHDILAGKVRDSDFPPTAIKAFHDQYPHAGSFVGFVREHKGDAALMGIINGIKGKEFELAYLDYLNHGHLPAGQVAELAGSPTQPDWDIAVRDSHGHIVEYLQLKATDSLPYIEHAAERNPDIEVVVTHEAFEHIHDPEMLNHVVDSGISNAHLEDVASDAVHGVAPEFALIPWFGFGVIGVQSWRRLRSGAPLIGVIRSAVRRGAYSAASRGVAYVAMLLGFEPIVGATSAVMLRLGLARYDAQKQFVEFVRAFGRGR